MKTGSFRLEFPFKYINTNYFGKNFRPYAEIYVLNKETNFYIKRTLIVDSGADFTLFPVINASFFGIDISRETKKSEIFGVGGKETVFLYKNLPIKIASIKLKIPVGFINRNDVPALLGRQHFMELFKVTLEEFKTIFQK